MLILGASIYFWGLSCPCKCSLDCYLWLLTVGLGVGSHRKYPSMSLWTTQTRAGLTSGTSGGQALSLGAEQWSTNGPLYYNTVTFAYCCFAWWPCEQLKRSLWLREAAYTLNDAMWCNKLPVRYQVVVPLLCLPVRDLFSRTDTLTDVLLLVDELFWRSLLFLSALLMWIIAQLSKTCWLT